MLIHSTRQGGRERRERGMDGWMEEAPHFNPEVMRRPYLCEVRLGAHFCSLLLFCFLNLWSGGLQKINNQSA
jgi:hypothetical protein